MSDYCIISWNIGQTPDKNKFNVFLPDANAFVSSERCIIKANNQYSRTVLKYERRFSFLSRELNEFTEDTLMSKEEIREANLPKRFFLGNCAKVKYAHIIKAKTEKNTWAIVASNNMQSPLRPYPDIFTEGEQTLTVFLAHPLSKIERVLFTLEPPQDPVQLPDRDKPGVNANDAKPIELNREKPINVARYVKPITLPERLRPVAQVPVPQEAQVPVPQEAQEPQVAQVPSAQ